MFEALAFVQLAVVTDTNGLYIGGATTGTGKDCLAGQACGGTFLGTHAGGEVHVPLAHGVRGYFLYGTGQFDGQGSGHEFGGTVFTPSIGFVNNCDGGRSHNFCDYR
jgi:hypothetical protein